MSSSNNSNIDNAQVAKASIKSLRISPRKLNLVASFIRGMKVQNALAQLTFSHKRIATQVKKCLLSAIANAENNHGIEDIDNLVVSEAVVGKAIVMKRMMPRGRGKTSGIKKFFSHLYITLKLAENNVDKKRQ